jgi:serine/threonine protein kinase
LSRHVFISSFNLQKAGLFPLHSSTFNTLALAMPTPTIAAPMKICIDQCRGCGFQHSIRLSGDSEHLGSGSFGDVYIAYDDCTNRRFAIKQVHASKNADTQAQRLGSVINECATHRLCFRHPNIVGFHDLVQAPEDNSWFIIQDLAPGGDLFSHLITNYRSHIYRNDTYVRHIALQLVDAVAHCHSRGVYHRDIKPENVLLSEDKMKVYLTDFGLATDKRRSFSFMTGSENYMAPGALSYSFVVLSRFC